MAGYDMNVMYQQLRIQSLYVFIGVLIGNVTAVALGWAVLAGYAVRHCGLRFEWSKLVPVLKYSFPFFLSTLVGLVSGNVEKLLQVASKPEAHTALRLACGSDEELYHRALPFLNLIRQDSLDHLQVYPKGSLYVTSGTERRSTALGLVNGIGWLVGGAPAPTIIAVTAGYIGFGPSLSATAAVYWGCAVLMLAGRALYIRRAQIALNGHGVLLAVPTV